MAPTLRQENCTKVAGNGLTMRVYTVDFSGSGSSLLRSRHLGKMWPMSSCACMAHTEEPRPAESGLWLPNETEVSFRDFMARNTPYCETGIISFEC